MARKVGWYAVFLIVLISIYKSPANSAFAVREAVGVAASFFASFVQFVGDIIGAQ